MSIARTVAIIGILMAVPASTIAAEKALNINGTLDKEVHLSLESNPSTGYSWMIKNLPEQLIFVSSVYEQSDDCNKGAVGCSGKETLTFIAQKPGKGELKLLHGRSFDKASWTESTVNVDIK